MKRKSTSTALRPGELAYVNDLRQAMLAHSTPSVNAVLYLVLAILICGICWASLARVDEVTRAEGRVVSAGGEQNIQSLDGGILQSLLVREGDLVEQDQPLAKIDPARAEASYREVLSKTVGLQGNIARLRAEAYDHPLDFPEAVRDEPKVVHQETQAFHAQRRSLEESVASLQRSYDLATKELALSEPLMRKGLVSEVEILRMRRDANNYKMQIAEQRNRFKAQANSELAQAELELAQTKERLAGNANVVEHTLLASPLKGIVKNIRIKTIGGVVRPGETIMEISPVDGRLSVEGKIKPSDVGFVHIGQAATVKISAYDYGIYGALKGEVELVSPDTLENEKKPGDDTTYYRVLVRTDGDALMAANRRLTIRPGMTSTIDIRTSDKTILDYLLKPVFKAKEAFRER